MNWLKISLPVDGEMAEAVAEVLARFAPAGVTIASLTPAANNSLPPAEHLLVCAYLPVDPKIEATRTRIEESLWHLGRIRAISAPGFEYISAANWTDDWAQNSHPVPVGRGLSILPPWLKSAPGERVPIRINPGLAFGTGTHPTTRLCLELLETRSRQESGFLDGGIFDVGCGSGILSIAALKLAEKSRKGGRAGISAWGVDTNPRAVEAAGENAIANSAADRVEFALGSVAEIKEGIFPLRRAGLVVANMIAPILLRLFAAGLADLIAPGGSLILAGMLTDQVDEMLSKLDEYGLKVSARRQISDWVALCVKR